MSRISDLLQQIMDAVYGKDVRGAIHDSIEECYSDVSTAKTLAQDATTNANAAATTANTAAANANAAKDAANAAAASAGAALDYVATVENSSSASAAHTKGSNLIYDGVLYEAINDIAVGDTLTVGTNIEAIPGGLGSKVSDLEIAVDSLQIERSVDWVQGGRSAAGGAISSNAKRITFSGYIPITSLDTNIQCASGYGFYVYARSEGTYLGWYHDGNPPYWSKGSVTVAYRKTKLDISSLIALGADDIAVVLERTDELDIDPSEGTNFSFFTYDNNIDDVTSLKARAFARDILTSTDDLNSVIAQGVYKCSVTPGLPANTPNGDGGLLVVTESNSFVGQYFYAPGYTAARRSTTGGSTWNDWNYSKNERILHSTDDLNDIVTSGSYKCSRTNGLPANRPVNVGGLLVVAKADVFVVQAYYTTTSVMTRISSDNGESWYAWVANDDMVMSSELPVLKLTGDISEMTKENAVTLDYNVFGVTGTCTCKWQGSSSQRYPKKNYTIKLDNGLDGWNKWASFVNSRRNANGNISRVSTASRWGSQTKFCTKANWVDASAARNIVCARLWGQIVNNRVAAGQISDNRSTSPNYGAIDGFPITIEINGQNTGLYTMNIPKDKWLFNMGEVATEYLISSESSSAAACKFNALAVMDGDDYSREYADENVQDSTIVTSFNALIGAAMEAGADWETALAPYLDIQSAIDYYIFSCCINHRDGMPHNMLYGTYDGTKWFIGAYDMDTTFGVDPYGTSWDTVVNDRCQFAQAKAQHRLFNLIYTYSKAALKTRYQQLRSGILSDANVWHEFSQFCVDIPTNDYTVDRHIWPNIPGTALATIPQYMNFYQMHCKYLDDEIAALT